MRISDWSSDVCSSDLAGRASVLVLGLTFKENVPDLRNTRVVDLVRGLQAYGHDVAVHDPLADPAEAKREYGIDLLASPGGGYDRTEERRVGKECVSKCRSRWSPYP